VLYIEEWFCVDSEICSFLGSCLKVGLRLEWNFREMKATVEVGMLKVFSECDKGEIFEDL
jgi:hypothetical protein